MINEDGNLIYYKTISNMLSETNKTTEGWYEYDEKGNFIHYKLSDGNEYWYEYEYYPEGDLIKSKTVFSKI